MASKLPLNSLTTVSLSCPSAAHFSVFSCNPAPLQNPHSLRLHPLSSLLNLRRFHVRKCLSYEPPMLLLLCSSRSRSSIWCSSSGRTLLDASASPAERKDEKLMISGSLLWRAVKLPIYSVALVPLTVGSAAAYLQTRFFSSRQFFLLLLSSILVIAWLNLSNDAYDAETGVDKDKEESVVNITGNQKGVLIAANACLTLGLSGIVCGALLAGDVRIAVLLLGAISCGYIYQCPPFRLSYKGLGEPLCFLAFGPLATTAFYLCQTVDRGSATLQLSKSVMAAAILIGLTTTLILFCSHFHQIEGDRSVGKISLMVRLGSERGAQVVELAVNSLYLLLAVLGGLKVLPMNAVRYFIDKKLHYKSHYIFLSIWVCHLHALIVDGFCFGVYALVGFEQATSRSKQPTITIVAKYVSLFGKLLFCFLTYPIGQYVKDFVRSNHTNKQAIFMAKYYAVRLHAALGAALAVGFFVAARVPALSFW